MLVEPKFIARACREGARQGAPIALAETRARKRREDGTLV
jgi:hypothetical protein